MQLCCHSALMHSTDAQNLVCVQTVVRDLVRQRLTALSTRINVPQSRLLDEFDKLFPEPALSASSQPVELQAQLAGPHLRFQHDCKYVCCGVCKSLHACSYCSAMPSTPKHVVCSRDSRCSQPCPDCRRIQSLCCRGISKSMLTCCLSVMRGCSIKDLLEACVATTFSLPY